MNILFTVSRTLANAAFKTSIVRASEHYKANDRRFFAAALNSFLIYQVSKAVQAPFGYLNLIPFVTELVASSERLQNRYPKIINGVEIFNRKIGLLAIAVHCAVAARMFCMGHPLPGGVTLAMLIAGNLQILGLTEFAEDVGSIAMLLSGRGVKRLVGLYQIAFNR